MKTIITIFALLFTGIFASAQNAGLLMPEMSQVLYQGYENKIVPVIPGLSDVSISVSGGTATKSTWSTNGIKYNGYNVRPTEGTNTVTISYFGKNAKGENVIYGKQSFRVVPFPRPVLLTESLSQSKATRINVGFTEFVALTTEFNVIGGEITIGNNAPVLFSESVVPAELLKNASVGEKLLISVNYKRANSEAISKIQGVIEISE